MKTANRTLEAATVELPGGRQFEAVMYRGAAGEALDLVLRVDFASDGHGWRSQAGTLALPPSALPEIVAALKTLGTTP